MILFLRSLFGPESRWSPHPNTFEKRSDEDLRTRTVFASLRAVAAEASALGTLNEQQHLTPRRPSPLLLARSSFRPKNLSLVRSVSTRLSGFF
jgi:hypothetical protein